MLKSRKKNKGFNKIEVISNEAKIYETIEPINHKLFWIKIIK